MESNKPNLNVVKIPEETLTSMVITASESCDDAAQRVIDHQFTKSITVLYAEDGRIGYNAGGATREELVYMLERAKLMLLTEEEE